MGLADQGVPAWGVMNSQVDEAITTILRLSRELDPLLPCRAVAVCNPLDLRTGWPGVPVPPARANLPAMTSDHARDVGSSVVKVCKSGWHMALVQIADLE